MKIDRLEVVPYALRFKEPYVTARGRLEERPLVLLRLHAGDVTGLGEAAPLLLRGGASLEQVAADLEHRCRPLLEGASAAAALERDSLLASCARTGASAPALAAVEIALLDLAGKLDGRPTWALLGASDPCPVSCNATLVAGAPDEVAENALTWAARGFRTFKLKMGVNGDVEQARAVRAALGNEQQIRVDANGAWSTREAIAKLSLLEDVGIELAEQPAATLAEMALVRGEVAVPLAADESVTSAEHAHEAVAIGACDAATVKIAKVGGLTAALRVVEVLPVYLSSALDGPVGIAAAVHLAQALPRTGFSAHIAHGLATADLFDGSIASMECEVKNAEIAPRDAPGLGVEIDEAALERARL